MTEPPSGALSSRASLATISASARRSFSASLVSVAVWALCSIAAPRAAHASRFVRLPYPQDVGSRQVAFSFELDGAHLARVRMTVEGAASASSSSSAGTAASGAASGASSAPPAIEVSGSAPEVSSELVVGGLAPATRYRWRISTDDGISEEGTVLTAPEDDRDITFLVYGDNRTDRAAHASVVRAMAGEPSDFLVHTGDMVHNGARWDEWLDWLSIERPLLRDRPIFPAIGNHEIGVPGSDGPQRYARIFRVPSAPGAGERYYTFRWGMARFFMLDAQDDFDSTERDWLDGVLGRADDEPGVKFRFAVMHHGPFSSGLHGDNEAARIARIPELLRKHKVDVLFSGHDHDYERGEADGLRYLVSGGGGAPLYREHHDTSTCKRFEATRHFLRIQLAGSTGTMRAIRDDGSLIESCSFAAGGAGGWRCSDEGAPPTPVAAAAAGGGDGGATNGQGGAANTSGGPPAGTSGRACSCSAPGSGGGAPSGPAGLMPIALAACLWSRRNARRRAERSQALRD